MGMRSVAAVLSCVGLMGPFLQADIVITELNYAPVDATGAVRNDLEYVEIFNDGSEPYDLAGYRFTNGVSYEFIGGAQRFIGAQSYLAICANVGAVKAYYGIANAIGDFSGVLDNAGENIELSNPQGAVVTGVSYNDRGRWPAGAKGTGHTLSLRNPYSDPSDPDNWTISSQMGGTPGATNFEGQASFQDTVLLGAGETWRFFKGTQEPSQPVTTWRQRTFSDGTWLSGATGIGYGDGDDATDISDMQNGYLTIFCRKAFPVNDVSQIDSLVLSITYDDGFYAYLNGTQVASRNVTSQAYNIGAGSAIEPTSEDIDITTFKGELINGTNVLAVQVHNANLDSSDLSFIPKLLSRTVIEPTQTATVPVVINEGHCRNGGSGERFIELYNTSNSVVDISGFYLTDDFANLKKFAVPPSTTLPARGRIAFTEAQTGLNFAFVPITREQIRVAFTNSAGTRVVDAVAFEPLTDGKSVARVPDGDRFFQPAANPSPGAPNNVSVLDGVVINEIMYNPLSGKDIDEYIELYNRSGSSADLSGWRLDGVGLTLQPGTSLAGGSYLVLARDPARIRSVYGLAASAVYGTAWTGNLKDGGERLELLDAIGNRVDVVAYRDGGEWPSWPDGGGSSLELVEARSDNSAASSWDASDDSAKATVQTITYGPVPFGGGESDFGMMLADEGIVIVDDISLVKTGTATNLILNGTFDSVATPWRYEGTHIRSGRTGDAALRIAGAGSLKLICWNGSGDYKVNRIEEDTTQQTTGTYTVSYKARWVVGSPRILTIGDYTVSNPGNAGLAGSNAVPVPARLGTPGARNSVTDRRIALTGSENMGPAVDRVAHSPGVPAAGEPVTVNARVRDPDGVASVRAFYRTETPAGAFSQVALTDPDGDGLYSGTLPGQTQGIRVLFYVEATDSPGATTRFPADPFERSHPPVLNPASPAPNDYIYCMYRHDTAIVSTQNHSYRFVLNQPNEDYLRTRKVHSNEMVDGTFIFGSGDVYYNAQIRFAGSPWLRESNSFNNSYSIKMPKDRPLHERKKSFNLDEHSTDGKERIAHYLLRQSAGSTTLPYYDFHTLVRFQLDSVKDATYEALDKPNSDYLAFWFPGADDGPFYEMDDRFSFNDNGDRTGNADGRVQYPPYGAGSGGDNRENYRWFFSTRSNENADDFQPLMDLANIFDEGVTPNTSFDPLVSQVSDVEELLRVWAIEMNIDDWDTWGGNRGKNCYLYASPVDGLFRLIPWDLELTFGNVNAFAMPSSSGSTYSNFFSEITRLINRPRLKRTYYGLLAEQVNPLSGFFHSNFLTPYMQQLSSSGVGSTNVGTAGGFVDQRANLIRSWIRASVYPQVRLEITTNGGSPVVAVEPTVDLAGNAPADIFFLLVLINGEPVDPAPEAVFSTSNMTGWSIDNIPLVPGLNTVEVLGLSSKGDIIDSDSINVTSSVNWNAPSISQLDPTSGGAGQVIEITGSDFHFGLKVFFGATQATQVVFNESSDPAHIHATVPTGLSLGGTTIKVRNADNQESPGVAFTVVVPPPTFHRGDANMDESIDLSDAVKVLLHLFSGTPVSCRDALDADDSGTINLTDATRILDYLFRTGPEPAAPFPDAGIDPSADSLECAQGL